MIAVIIKHKKNFISILFFMALGVSSHVTLSQNRTVNTSGSWQTTTNWAGGLVADQLAENVILSGNVDPIVRDGYNYTIGNLTGSGDNELTVESNASLTLGDALNSRSLSLTGNNPKLTITGTLIIWGNVTFTSKVVWEIRGTVIIKGSLILHGGANLDVKNGGDLQVGGNFIAGNNTDVTLNGAGEIRVTGDVAIGSGNLNGGGEFYRGGTCTGPASFCNNTTLPVLLNFFHATQSLEAVDLTWSTATEVNFEKFIIERSNDGKIFIEIGQREGSGFSKDVKHYSLKDTDPIIGTSYYRLKALDFDGYAEYFAVLVVDYQGDKGISIYPNPSTGNSINLRTNFASEYDGQVVIFDNLGIKVAEASTSGFENNITFSKTLEQGNYLLQYTSNTFKRIIRFSVQ